jgi:hypothetical protein
MQPSYLACRARKHSCGTPPATRACWRPLTRSVLLQALVGAAEAAAAHNCHGCTSLLARYEADPSLLEPQATAVA